MVLPQFGEGSVTTRAGAALLRLVGNPTKEKARVCLQG